MLINCPECTHPISDQAFLCPHCGYPMNMELINLLKPIKRKKLPNGFGQISELKGKNLKKPFRATVTINGSRKVLKPEAYFETYDEAYAALEEYHKNTDAITIEDAYKQWRDGRDPEKSVPKLIEMTWKHFVGLYDRNIKELTEEDIMDYIDRTDVNSTVKKRMRSVMYLLLNYAMGHQFVEENVLEKK